jgi:hypothetical protein
MKNIIFIVFFLHLFLRFEYCYCQEAGFIPPSPQSFSFVKASSIVSENEHTGSVNVNLPLFEFTSNKLSTDIALGYNGTGIKVDDLPTDTGMTWIIDAGGVITRTVNGLIDEEGTQRMNKTESEIILKTTSDCDADEEIRTACYNPQQIDTERDIFDFRFGGTSGSFYLDENFLPVFLKNDADVKIKNILPANETNNRKFVGFELTTADGTRYIFGGSIDFVETTASKAMPANPPGNYAVTSFFLKEIVHINGEKITFLYNDTALEVKSISEIHSRYLYSCCLGTGIMPDQDPDLRIAIQNHYTRNKKRLQQISNNHNSNTINFLYSEKANSDFVKYLSGIEYRKDTVIFQKVIFDYLFEDASIPNKIQRFYLTGINYYKGNSNFEKKFQFNYNDPLNLPKRLSYSQDMYGYYNGKQNQSLIAQFFGTTTPPSPFYQPSILATFGDRRPDLMYATKGALNEIIYPTGGKTKFDYEAPNAKAVFTTEIHMGEDIFSPGGTSTQILENLHFDQSINFTLTTYSAQGSQNHMKQAIFTVRDMNTNQQIYSNGKIYGYEPIDSINGTFNLQKNKRYSISFTPNGSADLKFTYSHKDPIEDFGIRLRSVSTYANGLISEYKRFYYRPAELYLHKEEEFGIPEMSITPNVQNVTFQETHEGLSAPVFYGLHSSNNTSELYNSRLQQRYRFVTCSIGGDNFENGGYQKTFKKDSEDILKRIQPASAGGGGAGSPSAGHGYSDYMKGLVNFFGYMLNNLYFPSKGNRLSFSGSLQNVKYYVKKGGNIYKSKQVAYQNRYNILKTNANLFVSQTFDDPTNALCGSSFVPRIANFYISTYKNYTVDTKLEKEIVTDYIDEVPLGNYTDYDSYFAAQDSISTIESSYRKLITRTNYEYSGMPTHSQVTKQTVISPENSLVETGYKYAHEKGNQLMINKNMIGIPLETVIVKKQDVNDSGKIISKTETVYPINPTEADMNWGLVLPLSLKSYDLQNPTVSSTDLSYDRYDPKGNLQQYTDKDGVSTTIIWGYNQTQPIAKIVGAKFRDIPQSMIDEIVTASNTDASSATNNDESALLSALDLFRNNTALSGYQITTYTYDPLIGVRSITPPSGIREVYLYDTANRLMEIREGNQTGKLLKEFKYNYKN